MPPIRAAECPDELEMFLIGVGKSSAESRPFTSQTGPQMSPAYAGSSRLQNVQPISAAATSVVYRLASVKWDSMMAVEIMP